MFSVVVRKTLCVVVRDVVVIVSVRGCTSRGIRNGNWLATMGFTRDHGSLFVVFICCNLLVIICSVGALLVQKLLLGPVSMFCEGFAEILDFVVVGISDASACNHASPLNPIGWFVGGIDVQLG